MAETNQNQYLQMAPSIVEAARLTIQGIDSKVQMAKANKDNKKTINNLESIINELIDNQNTLIRNQQVLENRLDAQTISDDDLSFISKTLIPLVKDILLSNNSLTEEEENKIDNQIKMIESIISTKLLKVLQLLGFNIKDAIGIPSTMLVKTLIESSVKSSDKEFEFNVLELQTQIKLVELSQNLEAYNRYLKLND